jgi:hypothetical protein
MRGVGREYHSRGGRRAYGNVWAYLTFCRTYGGMSRLLAGHGCASYPPVILNTQRITPSKIAETRRNPPFLPSYPPYPPKTPHMRALACACANLSYNYHIYIESLYQWVRWVYWVI